LDAQRTWLFAFKHWRIWDCGKSSKQWATAHCMYVWQHNLKLDTINVNFVKHWPILIIFDMQHHEDVKQVIDFQWFCGLAMIFWADACATQYEFIVVNGQTKTSQGSVATVLRWGGHVSLRLIFSRCCVSKIIKIGQCFTKLFKK